MRYVQESPFGIVFRWFAFSSIEIAKEKGGLRLGGVPSFVRPFLTSKSAE